MSVAPDSQYFGGLITKLTVGETNTINAIELMVYLSRNDYEMTKLKNTRFDSGLDFELNYGLNYGLVHRTHTNAN